LEPGAPAAEVGALGEADGAPVSEVVDDDEVPGVVAEAVGDAFPVLLDIVVLPLEQYVRPRAATTAHTAFLIRPPP